MVYDLKSRNVTGRSKGLRAVIYCKSVAEGCNVVINFTSDAYAAEAPAQDLKASNGTNAITVKAGRDQKTLVDTAKTTTFHRC